MKTKKPFDYSAHMKAFNAKRTPEFFAKSKKKRSEAMKRAWAKKNPAERIEINRKISASRTQRHREIPPRLKKYREKNRIKGINDFYGRGTIAVKEHKEYLGYLSSKNILECEPVSKACIIEKRRVGQKAAWDRLTPQEREERCKRSITKGRNKKERFRLLFETDVPREKNYCGVVTGSEIDMQENVEMMYG